MQQARVGRWLGMITLLAMASGAKGQFVAFNDHAPGLGTHSNATTWSLLAAPNGGLLKDITNGTDTAVSLDITRVGSGLATGGSAADYPAIGTPANLTFTNYVDFKGTPSAAVQISNVVVHYTFSGLNPSNRYSFIGSAVRGGSGGNYANRWTKITILGADSFTSLHTTNVITTARQPTFAPNEAAVNFGINFTGDMVHWEDIDSGDDGTFEITCEFYRGPLPPPYSATNNNPPYAYAITAIRLEEKVLEPVQIVSGPDPASTNVMQGRIATFEVTATGTAPSFRWYRADDQPIPRAVSLNSRVLTITNAQLSDAATYRVEVTNILNGVVSGDATLSVEMDTTPPSAISALGLLDGTNIVICFSELLDSMATLDPSTFHVHLMTGGGALNAMSAVVTNGTNVLLTTETAWVSNQNYMVTIDTNAVTDANGVSFVGGDVPLSVEVMLLSFDGTTWKYNAEGTDLGLAWYLPDNQFDDSGWSNGVSVFDAKSPQPPGRTTVDGFTVATQLLLTNSLFPATTDVIPTYYFRAHFNLPTTPEHVTSLKLRTLVDDFDDLFINGQEAHHSSDYPATNPPPRFGYAGGTAVSTASVQGPYDIATNLLVAGDNLAAAILNQVNPSSSDITFAYELVAVIDQFPEPLPALTIGPDPAMPGNILITWPDLDGVLYGATALELGDWSPIDTTATPGQFSVDPTLDSQKFFTLRR